MQYFPLLLLLAACPPPIPEDPDGDPGTDTLVRVPEVPTVGTATTELTLDLSGCVQGGVDFESEGISVVVEDGTCLTDLQGRAITGLVNLTLSPNATQPPWAPEDSLAFAVRLQADLGSAEQPVEVLFDPPVAAVAELNTVDSSGSWQRTEYIGNRVLQTGSIDTPPGLAETVEIPRTGVHALTYRVQQSADVGAERRLTCANPVTHTIDIGPASDPFPRPMSIVLINPRTGQIVAALHRAEGIPDGRSTEHVDGRTGEPDFEARTRAVGDRRVLEITTCYSNRLTIRYGLSRDPDALIDSITIESVEVSPTEAPEGQASGVYTGVVELSIRGCDPHGYKQLRAFRQAFDEWHAQNYAGDPEGTPDLTTSLFTTDEGSDQWFAKMNLHYWSQRVQDFPIAQFFPDAEVSYDDRRIILQLPCPEPRVAATTTGGLRELSPSDLAPEPSPIDNGDVGTSPQFVNPTVVVSQPNNGFALTNTATGLSQSLPVPGQTGVLVPDPIDDVFWLTTNTQVFAVDAYTTVPERNVDWDAFDVRDAAMRRDGSVMWLVGIDSGSPTIARWDPLRQQADLVTTEPTGSAWDCVSVSPTGDRLWVTRIADESVVGLDPQDHAMVEVHGVPGMQGCPVLDRSGWFAAVPSQDLGTDVVSILDLGTGEVAMLQTNGNRILPVMAPAAMQADFVFAAPDNDLVGTLERQGSDWLIQPAEEPVDDVTGVAGY